MKKAEQAANEVHAELERLESFRSSMSLHRPLRRKILGRICSHLNSIQVAAGIAQEPSGDGTATPRLSVSGNAQQVVVLALDDIKDLGKRGTATIWEIKNHLRIAYLGILDDIELHARIVEEQKAADGGTYRRRRRALLPEADFKQLEEGINPEEGKFEPPHLRKKAIILLRKFYSDSDDNGRYERAVTEHKGICLKWIALSMFCTIIVLSIPLIKYGLTFNKVREKLEEMKDMYHRIAALTVVLSSGILGSLLALLIKFRDVFSRMAEMRAHWAVMPAQAMIGATLSLVLFLIFRTGFVEVHGWESLHIDVVHLATFSFLAGFSEPFVLNIIQRTEKMIEGEVST
jgi:hypothetical protein